MTIPPAPLPGARELAVLLRGNPEPRRLFDDPNPRFFRRASYGLAASVRTIAERSNGGAQVWLPAYFCDEAADPLRAMGAEIQYYDLDDALRPDWSMLPPRMEGAAIVIVHYFGFPSATAKALEICAEKGATLIEDAAHVLQPVAGVGLAPYTVFSPRKLYAVPAGGCVVAEKAGGDERPALVGDTKLRKWLLKRLTQRALRSLRVSWHRMGRGFGVEPPSRADRPPPPGVDEWSCTASELRWLGAVALSRSRVAELRRRNYERLESRITSAGVRPLFDELPPGVTPYVFPVVAENGAAAVAAELQAEGIPASRWPDMPIEVEKNAEHFPVSIQLHRNVLLLPLHQDLSLAEMDLIAARLNAAGGRR